MAAVSTTTSTWNVDTIRRWSASDVAAWLSSVRLEAHAPAFEANHINGKVILEVDKNALKNMGITAVGDRVRLDKAIRDLKRAASSASLSPSSAAPPPAASSSSTNTAQRPVTVSHSSDQLAIHGRRGSSSGPVSHHGPTRQASTGLPTILQSHHHHHHPQQPGSHSLSAASSASLSHSYGQYQYQQSESGASSSFYPSPYANSQLSLPQSSTPAGGGSTHGYPAHPLPPLPREAHADHSNSSRPGSSSGGANTSGNTSASVGPSSSGLHAGSSIASSSSSSGSATFSNRRSAHPRPPPLTLAHSANYALPSPNNAASTSSNNLQPGGSSQPAVSPYRPRSASGAGISTFNPAASGNPLVHSLYANNPPQVVGSTTSSGPLHASTSVVSSGPHLPTVIGSGWTAHPAQQRMVGSIVSSVNSGTRLPSPTYPPNANANQFYGSAHRKQPSLGQLSTATSGRPRTAAGEYAPTQTATQMRNHNASSYVKKGYGPSAGGRSDKMQPLMYNQPVGAYGQYYYTGHPQGHAHQLSTSSNSSTGGGGGGPTGLNSSASSPTAAVFTPSTARPGGIYGGSDESGLEGGAGGNSPYSRTPTTPSYPPGSSAHSLEGTMSSYTTITGHSDGTSSGSNAPHMGGPGLSPSQMRSIYQPSHAFASSQSPHAGGSGTGKGSHSVRTKYTIEDVKRRTLKFHCEELGTSRTIPVDDCRDAYDVLARVLRKFGIRGGVGLNAYPPYHGQSVHSSESDEDGDSDGGYGIESGDTWAIFAKSPDGKTKKLSDNELIAICHAPQPFDPLRENGLHLRRDGTNNTRLQQTRRTNKLNKFFGESDVPEAGSAAAGASGPQSSPGANKALGRDNYETEAHELLAPLSSNHGNANKKPKMNRASTISFMSGLGLAAGRNNTTASAERDHALLQQQQHMALQQYRDQHLSGVQLPGHPYAAAGMYALSVAPSPSAFSNDVEAPLQPPPIPTANPTAAAAVVAAVAQNSNVSSSGSSMLGLLPRKARNFFGTRPPSELISSNLQDYFPAAEKKVLERTARKSVYSKASMRSKRDSTWSFQPPDGYPGMVDDETGEALPIRRSAESYEHGKAGADRDNDRASVSGILLRDGSLDEGAPPPRTQRLMSNASSRSGNSSDPGTGDGKGTRSIRSRAGIKNGPPMLPPVVGRSSLDDWSASLTSVASPVLEHPTAVSASAREGPASLDSVPETPTALPPLGERLTPTTSHPPEETGTSMLAPPPVAASSSSSNLGSRSASPGQHSVPLPPIPPHGNRPRSVRRNSGESSISRRSFARPGSAYAFTERDRDRSDVASLLTVDEITQDIENRSEPGQLPYGAAVAAAAAVGGDSLGANNVLDADGNPVPTRKSLTGRWTGDADSISVRSKKPTILLTDDDRSSIAARSLRSLKRNCSSASKKSRRKTAGSSLGPNAAASSSNSADEPKPDSLAAQGVDGGAAPPIKETEEEDADADDEDFDDEDEEFDEEEDEEAEGEEEPVETGAEEVSHPAHRAGKARRKWIKGALIGAGSFGSVYLGMDQRTGLYMAVKMVELPTGKSNDEQRKTSMLEALEREIALLKTLEHPNIVQYLDSYADDSHLNIFLEYVPGGSVVAILRDWGTFQEPLVQAYITQTLVGLQFLHDKNIVHSDIKGANILVDTKGQIKISDFGISKKDTEELTASGGKKPKKQALQGSIFWMAPEAVKQGNSRKGDIWSVGCLVVEMLTGMHPWPSLDQMQALFRIGSGKSTPPLPEDISENCRHFLNWTFELDHTKRPTAEELSAHAFLTEKAELEPDEPADAAQNGGGLSAGAGGAQGSGATHGNSNVLAVSSTNTTGSTATGRKGKGGKRRAAAAATAAIQ
ncbi:ATP binding [Tilletia horrida]|uniref:mitogen-activated protein kinase kinase kinase n=1 Tax=Tilletia horrida TaxID=155126 RepID=A0AAN6GJD1_9BASI|nr:ATP binding [Tilletia horrida]